MGVASGGSGGGGSREGGVKRVEVVGGQETTSGQALIKSKCNSTRQRVTCGLATLFGDNGNNNTYIGRGWTLEATACRRLKI